MELEGFLLVHPEEPYKLCFFLLSVASFEYLKTNPCSEHSITAILRVFISCFEDVLFLIMCMCAFVCGYVHVSTVTSRRPEALDPVEWGPQEVGNHLIWALASKLVSSVVLCLPNL